MGKAVAVVVADQGGYKANIDALESILLGENVKDSEVMLVSVAGLFRMGKSFLLNLMMKYLETEGDWLANNETDLKGFTWRGGTKPETSGIFMWSEPIIRRTAEGKKVAILLMDTEGTFDTSSTLKQNATIFALSTLLSSVQIYNLADNILEDALQYLQFFTEYGRLAQGVGDAKPFQNLVFVVRDWAWSDKFDFGWDGGRQLLDHRFKVDETVPESSLDSAAKLRLHVRSCFEQLLCCLLPHPGLTVSTRPTFTGQLRDIEPDFLTHVTALFDRLFSPEHITVKTGQNGVPVTGALLCRLFATYDAIFAGDSLPAPRLAFEMTMSAKNQYAVESAKDNYRVAMEKACGEETPYFGASEMASFHARYLDLALVHFDQCDLLGTAAVLDKYRDGLVADLDRLRAAFEENNERKTQLQLRTAACLILLSYLIYTVSNVCAWLGLAPLASLFTALLFVCLVGDAVWCHAFFTNDARGLGRLMDHHAKPVIDWDKPTVSRQAWARTGLSGTQEMRLLMEAKKLS